MGTRNLTCVVVGGEYKVAQYGQWDGYPNGQGLSILKFISDGENLAKLKNNLKKVRFLDYEGKDKDFIESYNANTPEWSSEAENRTPEQKHWAETFASRDLGGKILISIANSQDEEIVLKNSIDFAADSLFCEWVWVIDFDKGTYEGYEGYNKIPLEDGERFKGIATEIDSEYSQVKAVATFKLDSLPTKDEFLAAFPKEEDED